MYYNNKKLALSVFWLISGLALIVLAVAEKIDPMYSGMGAALAVVGALQIAKNLRYRRDAEYREKLDTEAGDERNRFLRMKSWAWTGYIIVLAEGVGVIAATLLGQKTVQLVLSYSICLILAVYWITYTVLSRKY